MSKSGYPQAVDELIDLFKTLPSVGKRSAERMALAMLKWQPEKMNALGELISSLPIRVTPCPECGNFAEDGLKCTICASPLRDTSTVCVVEDPAQIRTIEASALYKGVYHVLGGKLSPLSGKGVDDINMSSLVSKIAEGRVMEIILALSPDVEGQATAVYVGNIAQQQGVKVTRLAQGLPAGADISYADSATIAVALNGRTDF